MIGDIVTYQGFKWVVARQDMTSIPAGTFVLLRNDRDGLRIALTAFGGWVLVKRPAFTADFEVRWEKKAAVIVSDNDETVRIVFDRALDTGMGIIEFNGVSSDVAKGSLVLENIHRFESQI